MQELYIGQNLKCLNGELVIINELINDKIIIEYKNKLYERPLSIIGEKLFLMNCDKSDNNVISPTIIDKDNSKSCPSEIKYNCNDCMLNKREDCFGEKEICDDFKPCPRINKEEIENWPTVMGGPYDY